jgi:hypothetical protein
LRSFPAQMCLNKGTFVNGYRSVVMMLKNDLHVTKLCYEHFLKFLELLILSVHKCILLIINEVPSLYTCVGAVGRGTALQAGRSRVRFPMLSLDFFIDIILPAALWPCG